MKIAQVCFTAAAILGSVADAKVSLKSLFRHSDNADEAAESSAPESIESQVESVLADEKEDAAADAAQRKLSHNGSSSWCDHQTQTYKWHPRYSEGWTNGYCTYTKDCNSPGYSSELACCKAAYGGQISGYCVSKLPSPPTTSPTKSGGLDIYYPDYNTAWTEAGCINTYPMPSGRPTYATMLACCKGAYGGQVSGKCLSMLPSPPSTSPTTSGGMADFFYADYETAWSVAGCSNKLPLPYTHKGDRPTYSTQIACCKGAYGGQMSGACIGQLPSPPTTSPTGSGGLDFFYPDYDTAWSEATCLNARPLPYKNKNDRPSYSTMIACCKGAYGGQTSGACLANLPSPPTTSPTENGGLKVWYGNHLISGNDVWANGVCVNTRPLPSGAASYSSKSLCCSSVFGGQGAPGACACDADPCHSCACPNFAQCLGAGRAVAVCESCDCPDLNLCADASHATDCALP